MQKGPADVDGLHIDVKFKNLAGSETDITTEGVYEFESVFRAVLNFAECNELGEIIGEETMTDSIAIDRQQFIGTPMTAVVNGILTPTSPTKRTGQEDIVFKTAELVQNPNKLYKCYIEFCIDGGASNVLGNKNVSVNSNEFIVMGNKTAEPTLIRDPDAPDNNNIYLLANWGDVPVSQKTINIKDLGAKTTLIGTSINLVSLDDNGNYVNAANGVQKIVLCKTNNFPSSGVTVIQAGAIVLDSNNYYWVKHTGLEEQKTYSINAKVITRGLMQSTTSPSVIIGHYPGRPAAPALSFVRPHEESNKLTLYYQRPSDLLSLVNTRTATIRNGLRLQSFKLTKGGRIFTQDGILQKSDNSVETNQTYFLGSILATSDPLAAGTTLRVDGSVYNRGKAAVASPDVDVTGLYSSTGVFPNLQDTNTVGQGIFSADFSLTAVYSGDTAFPDNHSTAGSISPAATLTVPPSVDSIVVTQDLEVNTDTDSVKRTYAANGDITLKVKGNKWTNNFSGATLTGGIKRVKLYWALTDALEVIKNGTKANGSVQAVAARSLLATDFTTTVGGKSGEVTNFTLTADSSEKNSRGAEKNYVINITQLNIPGADGQKISFYATLQSDVAYDVSRFYANKSFASYTKQANPTSAGALALSLSPAGTVVAKFTPTFAQGATTSAFGLGDYESVKTVEDLIKDASTTAAKEALAPRLQKAKLYEANLTVILGYQQKPNSNSEFSGVSLRTLNAASYEQLIGTGYNFGPDDNSNWNEGVNVLAWIEAVNVKSIFNSMNVFESRTSGSITAREATITVVKLPQEVSDLKPIRTLVVPTGSDGEKTASAKNVKYEFQEPAGQASRFFKIVYTVNGSVSAQKTFWFGFAANERRKNKKLVVTVSPGSYTDTSSQGSAVVFEEMANNVESVILTHNIGSYVLGDLIKVDIYTLGASSANAAIIFKTLNLVPALPAKIKSIAFSTDAGNNDVVTYTISNNGSAIKSLFSLDVFGNLLLPSGVEPVTELVFDNIDTLRNIGTAAVVNAVGGFGDDGITPNYTSATVFSNTDTNMLKFINPKATSNPYYKISSVTSVVASGADIRLGAAVPDETTITINYNTASIKTTNGVNAGLQAVFAILQSDQKTMASVASYKLNAIANASDASPV
jgi:hypothetical protein